MDPDLTRGHWRALLDYEQAQSLVLRPIVEVVYDRIADYEAASGARFRVDATQFLLVNVVELVAKPRLRRASGIGWGAPRYPFWELEVDRRFTEFDGDELVRVDETCRVVLNELREPDEANEVSSHAVLVAVGTAWERLKTLNWS